MLNREVSYVYSEPHENSSVLPLGKGQGITYKIKSRM
jgi:hypothetical protein